MANMPITYEAAIYSRDVTYRDLKGKVKTVTLDFAIDPLQLMAVIAGFQPQRSRSGNPAKRNQELEISDAAQLQLIHDLAVKAAGFASEDGETWEQYENFADTVAGKAFLTKLLSSDGDRKEFAEKVVLAPFKAFVDYAASDDSNTPAEVQRFQTMLEQLENIFKTPAPNDESIEEKRARLIAELESVNNDAPQTDN